MLGLLQHQVLESKSRQKGGVWGIQKEGKKKSHPLLLLCHLLFFHPFHHKNIINNNIVSFDPTFMHEILSSLVEMEAGEGSPITTTAAAAAAAATATTASVVNESSEGTGRRFKRICVFCGSRAGSKSSFSEAALQLGHLLVERKIDLVYGGGSGGLMGLISQTVHNGGRHVLGVIPRALMAHEVSGQTNGEEKTVADMHQRKSEMAKNADAFIALPGGYGTMEELLEVITWSQLGIHDKPVGLLNVDGYYDCLLALFDKGVEEGFIEDSARHILISANTAAELLKKMEEYKPVHDKVAARQRWEVDQLSVSSESGEGQTS